MLANRFLNYNRDQDQWHKLFNQFCNRHDVDTHHQTPFFWFLIDHRIYDIDQNTLSYQLDLFKDQNTDIIYQE